MGTVKPIARFVSPDVNTFVGAAAPWWAMLAQEPPPDVLLQAVLPDCMSNHVCKPANATPALSLRRKPKWVVPPEAHDAPL